jgi:hypothetical protein
MRSACTAVLHPVPPRKPLVFGTPTTHFGKTTSKPASEMQVRRSRPGWGDATPHALAQPPHKPSRAPQSLKNLGTSCRPSFPTIQPPQGSKVEQSTAVAEGKPLFRASRSAAELAQESEGYAEPGLALHKVCGRQSRRMCHGCSGWATADAKQPRIVWLPSPAPPPHLKPRSQGPKHLEEHWHKGRGGLRPEDYEEEEARLRELQQA